MCPKHLHPPPPPLTPAAAGKEYGTPSLQVCEKMVKVNTYDLTFPYIPSAVVFGALYRLLNKLNTTMFIKLIPNNFYWSE